LSRYTQIPSDGQPAPATVWQWAAELDQLADDIEAGRARAAVNDGGRPFGPAEHRSLASSFRINALISVLTIDGVPSMQEGWALPPHPVRVAQVHKDFGLGNCPAAATFPPLAALEEAVEAFYEALDRTVRGCRRGSENSSSQLARTHEPCLECARWADQYLAVRATAR
jgi:hypothetical protein